MSDLVIGLNGLKESGKDTAGKYLVERYGFTRLSFAALLKQSAAAALGIDPELWETWKNDPDAVLTLTVGGVVIVQITVREYLQRYGTEAHRDIFGEDFWRKALWASLPESDGTDRRYVITDARFEDELSDVVRKDGLNIRILREAVEGTGDTHASEAVADADLIDFYVRNNGTMDELYEQLDTILVAGCALEPLGNGGPWVKTSSTEKTSDAVAQS